MSPLAGRPASTMLLIAEGAILKESCFRLLLRLVNEECNARFKIGTECIYILMFRFGAQRYKQRPAFAGSATSISRHGRPAK